MDAFERAVTAFSQAFGAAPALVARAPGRVNLIGEHVDYSGGLVLPIAIDRDLVVAVRARSDGAVNAVAADAAATGWQPYIEGVRALLSEQSGASVGADISIAGDVPRGAGLSSSAALEVATATALAALHGIAIDPVDLALLCQRAENEWAGVNCGIMDQFASALARAQHALLIHCDTLSYQHVPIPPEAAVIVAESGVERSLTASHFNTRFQECADAARLIGVALLKDAQLADTESLPEPLRRRARHVVTEIARTRALAAALQAGDLPSSGVLLDESHESLRNDYEVSVPELDRLVAKARRVAGVYGSRLTGAGFGGCTMTLCAVDAVEPVLSALSEYRAYRVVPSDGAGVL